MPAPDCLLIGSIGMLGRELARAGEARGMHMELRADPDALDVTRAEDVRREILALRPKLVLNASGYTDVDGAEANRDMAYAINRDGPANLASACREVGAVLVHFSTDYVFGGDARRPYGPEAEPAPQSVYGASKLAGERVVRESGVEHLLVRTSWLFAPHGGNFVRTIRRLATERETLSVVDDQTGRPTYAADLAGMTFSLLDADARGLVHAGNDESCTWCEFARAIVEGANLACDVHPCTTEEYPLPACRPAYSVLDLDATLRLIGPVRTWREALADCLHRLDDADSPATG